MRCLPLALVALLIAGCGGMGRGPLAELEGTSSWAGGSVRPDEFNVTSIPLPQYHGSRPAVLLDVRPADAKEARGLTLRYAASTGEGLHIGLLRGWRPRERDLRPLGGFEIRNGDRAAVVIGARAARPGIYLVRAFVLRYRIGGTHYRAHYEQGIKTCIGTGPSCPD